MSEEIRPSLDERQKIYWKKNTSLIRNLLIIWAFISLVAGILLAGPFHGVPFFGVTLSFWIAQQGSIIVFVILIFYYAVRLDRLDKEYIEAQKEQAHRASSGNGGSQ